MDLQLMDYRNSSKCASAPPLCFRNAAPSGVTCARANAHRLPVREAYFIFPELRPPHTRSPLLSSPRQVYGPSPTDDDINQNSTLHSSIKASGNLLASSFFGELAAQDRTSLMTGVRPPH